MVALISHFKKKTMKSRARMAVMLSVANARTDHFLNEGGCPSIARSLDLH